MPLRIEPVSTGSAGSQGTPFVSGFGARGSLKIVAHEPIPDRPNIGPSFFDAYAFGGPTPFVNGSGARGVLNITVHEPIPNDRPNMTTGFAI